MGPPIKNQEKLEVLNFSSLWNGGTLLGNSSEIWTEGYNDVGKDYEKPTMTLHICTVAFYVIMIPLGLVSNLLIIIPYMKNASLRRVTSNFFIVHMAVINMVNICIFYPLLLKIVFGGKNENGNPKACLVTYVAFDMIFIEPSLFSVLCVSVNQLLLIVSPQKMYRRCCTHKAIGAALVLFWSCLCMKAGMQMAYRKVDFEPFCVLKHFTNEWMYGVFFFFSIFLLVVPTLIIPVCHITVLCYIRSSRKRAKGGATSRSNAIRVEVDEYSNRCTEKTSSTIGKSTGKLCIVSEVSMVTSISMAPVSEVDSHRDPIFPSCSHQSDSGHFNARLITGTTKKPRDIQNTTDGPIPHGTVPNENAVNEDELPMKTFPKKRALSRGLSRRFSSLKLTKRTSCRIPSRALHVPGKAEVRLIKMMIAMYTILVVGWVASLVQELLIKDRFVYFIIYTLGRLIPLFHTLVPYIYLWGNRHYHEAIKTLFGFSRICRTKVRPN